MIVPLLKAFWDFLTSIPWQVWAGLLLAGLLVGSHLSYGSSRYDAGAASVQADWDKEKAKTRAAIEEAERQVAVVEKRMRDEYAAAADRFLKEQENAKLQHDATVTGLLAGTERLRRSFRCPAPGVPGASAGPTGSDDPDGAGFDAADAVVAFGIARDGDTAIRRLTLCQDVLRSAGLAPRTQSTPAGAPAGQ